MAAWLAADGATVIGADITAAICVELLDVTDESAVGTNIDET